MLDFNPIHDTMFCMWKKIGKAFGISVLSLCLAFAFLSNDKLTVRLKGSQGNRVGQKRTLVSESSVTIHGTFEQEESKDKDSDDKNKAREISEYLDFKKHHLTSIFQNNSTFSYILQDSYLSLPPPV